MRVHTQTAPLPYEVVKESCRRLTPDQMKELRDILALQIDAVERTSYSREEVMWFDALHLAISKSIGTIRGTYSAMRKTDLYPRFRASMKVVEEFTRSCDMGRLSTPQRKKWYNLLAEVLVTWCDGLDAPMTFKLVVNQAERIPGLVDKSFPGYVEAKLIKKIL